MLKKSALVVLLGMCNVRASDNPKLSVIEKIKNSTVMAKVVGGIIPCIATFISMEAVIKANNDNPQRHTIVDAAYYIKWISLVVATFFCNWLFRIDFKQWMLPCPEKDTSIVIDGSHIFQEMDSISL